MAAERQMGRRGVLAGGGAAALAPGGAALAQAGRAAPAQSSPAAPAQFSPAAPAQSPPAAPAPTPPAVAAVSADAARAVGADRDAILRISREVWALGEVSLGELRSAQVHVRELQAAGFRIASTGTAGVPTAFIAEWSQGSGGPVLGYLPEYDALPSLGNAAEPRQAPGPTPDGHGCGHNLLGAGCTGGAMALKRMMQAAGTPGTVRVYGCAAEETEGAKVYMARAGLFDDLAAALAWHPAPFAAAGLVRMTATNNAKVIFRGRTAHAGNTPWEGRSALKAAELFGVGVQMMREHILPSARIHYVYEQAGVAPNVVPDLAQIWITIRDADREKVEALTHWIRQIAEGAAMATQTRAELDLYFGMYDLLPNEPLARLLHRHLEAVPLRWTDEETRFAHACQRAMGVPEAGLATRVLPFIEQASAGGSTDVGDISYQVPVGLFGWPTLPLGIGLHTWPVTACGGMSIGDKASLNTAIILAAAGFELMTQPALLAAARDDFRRRRGDRPFASAIPASRTRPLGLPLSLRRTGADEVFGQVQGG